MTSPALAFVAGLGSGYVAQQQRNIENARADAAEKRAQDFHDLQMRNAQRDADLQAALANAARPAQVDAGAGGYTKPDTADNIDVGQPGDVGSDGGPALAQGTLVNGKAYANSGDAATAAAGYNDPNAVTLRQVQAYQQASKPVEAMNLQKGAFQFTKEQQEFARKLKDENAFDTAKALRTGDPQQIKDAFNQSGAWKIEGDPVVTPKKRTDIPGLPEVTTYDVTVNLKGPDGKTVQKTVNSHDFSLSVLPYEKALDLQQKGQRNEDRAAVASQIADIKGTLAEVAGRTADAKVAAAEAKAKSGQNQPSHEERLRASELLRDARRGVENTQNAINTLQRDSLFMRNAKKDPNSAEALQLAGLQDQLKQHQQDRDLARQTLTQPSLTTVSPSASTALPMPKTQGELKAGKVYLTNKGPATWNGSAFVQK